MDDEYKFDAESLDEIARFIAAFCSTARETVSDGYRKVNYLADEWDDRETFTDNVLFRLESIKANVADVLDAVEQMYPRYFSDRAQAVNARPTFRGGSSSVSRSSGGSVGGGSHKSMSTRIDEIFAKTNKDIKTKIMAYLMQIRFVEPGARSSYYDPNGKSRRGLYKNIMAVDINSPSFRQDLLYLTGQHIFFYLQRKNQLNLIDSLSEELNFKARTHDAEFDKLVQSVKNGEGFDFTYIKCPDDSYKYGMTFFGKALNGYVNNDVSGLKKYFSHTYDRFVEILINIDYPT